MKMIMWHRLSTFALVLTLCGLSEARSLVAKKGKKGSPIAPPPTSLDPSTTLEDAILSYFNSVDPQAANVFATDAEFKLCLAGSPGCVEGDFDTVLKPIADILADTQLKGTFVRGGDELGGFLIYQAYLETMDGCGGIYSGTAYVEMNTDGLVTKYYSYSDDSQDVIACIDNYLASL